MSVGLVGRKCGMTRIFTENGDSVPVTVIEALPNRVTTREDGRRDGYRAVQVTVGAAPKAHRHDKPRRALRESRGRCRARPLGVPARRGEGAELAPGAELKVDLFEAGQFVDVTGTTKGKGYAGIIKRHHFSHQYMSHGNSLSHRAPGAIGQRQTPGRVFPGKRMAGRLGDDRSRRSISRSSVDAERNLLLVKGAVPGSERSSRRPSGRQSDGQDGQVTYGGDRAMKVKLQGERWHARARGRNVRRAVQRAARPPGRTAYLAGGRAGTKAQKNRADVSGGGRSRGSRRARAGRVGSIRSPIWVGGGRTFAALRAASSRRSTARCTAALCARCSPSCAPGAPGRHRRSSAFQQPKTKELRGKLEKLELRRRADRRRTFDVKLWLAARNLPNVDVLDAQLIDPVSLVGADKVLVTAAALKIIEERLR